MIEQKTTLAIGAKLFVRNQRDKEKEISGI